MRKAAFVLPECTTYHLVRPVRRARSPVAPTAYLLFVESGRLMSTHLSIITPTAKKRNTLGIRGERKGVRGMPGPPRTLHRSVCLPAFSVVARFSLVMFYYPALNHEYHVFTHIGGEVGDALQALGNTEEVNGALDS